MNEVLIGLIGVVAGVGLQALMSWLTEWRQSRRAHRVWLMEKRYEAYSEVIRATTNLCAWQIDPTINIEDPDIQADQRAFGDAWSKAYMLLPPKDQKPFLEATIHVSERIDRAKEEPEFDSSPAMEAANDLLDMLTPEFQPPKMRFSVKK